MTDKKYLDKEKEQNIAPVNCEHTARLRPIVDDDSKKRHKLDKNPFNFNKDHKMSSPYRRNYIILAACVLIFFVIAYQFVKVRPVDFDKLAQNLSNSIEMSDYKVGDPQLIRRNYGINQDEILSYVYIAPKSNMQASEMLILQCKPEYVNDVMAKIQHRIDAQANTYKSYAKDQYDIISNSILKKNGNYVYFISSSDKDKEKVNNAIKESYK